MHIGTSSSAKTMPIGNEKTVPKRDLLIARTKASILEQARARLNKSDTDSVDLLLMGVTRARNTLANGVSMPYVGLRCLSAYVREFGYTAKIIECTEVNCIQHFDEWLGANRATVVGFYCSIDNATVVNNAAGYIKRKWNVPVVVGGPQAYVLERDFLEKSGVDFVVEGEGEYAIKALLDYIVRGIGEPSSIGNAKYLDKGQIVRNFQYPLIDNLDSLPFARIRSTDTENKDIIYVLTGRGCPFNCAFCFEGANTRKLRYRSLDNVFEEIDYLLAEFPFARAVQLFDDTFTCSQERVREFCKRMRALRQDRDIVWTCEVHVHTLYDKMDLLEEMVASGCIGFQIGLESGSDKVLKLYRKHTNREMILEFIDNCKRIGVQNLEGNIIFGGPYESAATIEDDLSLCAQMLERGHTMLHLSSVFYHPLPNTDITLNPNKYGITVLPDELDSTIMSMRHLVTSTDFLTYDELYAKRVQFDLSIEKKYVEESIKLTKTDILKCVPKGSKVFNQQTRWGMVLSRMEHMANFLLLSGSAIDLLDSGDSENALYVYPVRTFENLEYLTELEIPQLLGLKSECIDILMASTGKLTVLEMAERFGLSLQALIEICNDLANHCLLYYSYI